MENRFLKFLEEIASTDWEYSDGTPMAEDARKHLDEFYRIAELEQQLSEAQSELALSIKERIELGGKLSRYQGGVEVESRLLVDDNEVLLVSDVREWPIGHGFDIGQQVRVPVLPKEVE